MKIINFGLNRIEYVVFIIFIICISKATTSKNIFGKIGKIMLGLIAYIIPLVGFFLFMGALIEKSYNKNYVLNELGWHYIQGGLNSILMVLLLIFCLIIKFTNIYSFYFILILFLVNILIGFYSILTKSRKKLLITGKLAEKIYFLFF